MEEIERVSGSPLLRWNAPVFSYPTLKYEVYRKINDNNFLKIKTINDRYTSSYHDIEMYWDQSGDGHEVKYKVKAIPNDDAFSIIESNIRSIYMGKIFFAKPTQPVFSSHDEEALNFWSYPNPFNPSTTIEYEIKEASNVLVELYDNNGKLVNEVSRSFKITGTHRQVITGHDLANGIYFLKITLIEKRISKTMKIVLLK